MTPNPKHKRMSVNGKAWAKLVGELYDREQGFCQRCGKWLFGLEANPHHIKSVGAGGDDVLENLELLCTVCHVKEHNGEFLK